MTIELLETGSRGFGTATVDSVLDVGVNLWRYM